MALHQRIDSEGGFQINVPEPFPQTLLHETKKGKGWRRFKCRKCGQVVSFNTWNQHAVKKHEDEYRAAENPWTEFFGWDTEVPS